MRYKTKNNGTLRAEHVGEKVTLSGWVMRRRDHGGVIFVDLRDRSGFSQVVFNPERSEEAHKTAEGLHNEYVITVIGEIVRRTDDMINPKIPTGEIEVMVDELTVLNVSEPVPFQLDDKIDTGEDVRLRYRYLDLRRGVMLENMKKRHELAQAIRTQMNERAFMEIETPILNKSTPEGARDFIVPSRLNRGEFYALPQSPQIFKQILMVAGMERYYQIVKCFRDEDLRADRQPEFTQVDIETSFLTTEEFLTIMEEVLAESVKDVYGLDIQTPFPRLSYWDAMERYGSDKPDTRFGLELTNVQDVVKDSDFQVFKNVIESGGIIRCLNVKGGEALSRKDIDEYTKYVGIFGAKGLAWMRVTENGLESNIVKFFSEDIQRELMKVTNADAGDILFFVAADKKVVYDALGNLRLKVGEKLGLIDKDKLNFLWVVDFPLFEYDAKEKRLNAIHHPFTLPVMEDIEKIESEPLAVRSDSYDIVLNGVEIGGGSQRIYSRDVQMKVFKALGIKEEDAKKKFGFLMEALSYGAPPHAGLAFGFDRLVMLLQKLDSIRDTMAFPKTQKGQCLMSASPSSVSEEQLDELGLEFSEE